MSTINDTDQFLVQRGTTSFKQSAVDLMSTIQDTDLMLIQRGGLSYKVTCLDVKDQLGGGGSAAPVLDSVVLTQDAPVNTSRFTGKSFTTTTTVSGGAPAVLEMTGAITGELGIQAGSAPITANNYPGTSGTDIVLDLQDATNLGTLFEVGDVVTANAIYTPETSVIASIQTDLYSNYSIENGFQSQSGTGAFTVSGTAGSEFFSKDNSWSQGQHDTTVTVNFDPPIPFQSSVRVYAWGSRPNHQCTVYTSIGNYVTTNLINDTGDITNLANKYDGTGTVSKLVFTGGYENNTGYNLGGIMVDENVTSLLRVDPTSSRSSGVIGDLEKVFSFNDTQDIALFEAGDIVQGADPSIPQVLGNWAAGITGWSAVSYAGTPINGFDGDDSSFVLAQSLESQNLNWQAKDEDGRNTTITNITKLEINWSCGDPAAVYINGSKVVDYPGASSGWRDYSAYATSLSSFRLENKRVQNGAAISLRGVRINDKYLIDNIYGVAVVETDVSAKTVSVNGGSWSTDGAGGVPNTVSTLDTKQGKGTISAINGSQVTITPFTDNCFKEGQYLTVNKAVTVDPVTDSISTYDAGTKTITLSGDKDLLQFANGDAVYMTDAAGTLVSPTFTTSAITGTSTTAGPAIISGTDAAVFSENKIYPPNYGGSYSEAKEVRYFFDAPLSGSIEIGIGGDRNNFPTEVRVSDDGGTTSTIAFSGTPRTSAVEGTYYADGDLSCSILLGNWTDINWIQVKRSTSSDTTTVMGVAVDKVRITVANNGGTTTLAFADNTNLDKFADGDVVVYGKYSDGLSASGDGGVLNPGQAFDGNTSTQSRTNGGNQALIWTWDQGIEVTSTVKIYYDNVNAAGSGGTYAPLWINKLITGQQTHNAPISTSGGESYTFSFSGTLKNIYLEPCPDSATVDDWKNWTHLQGVEVDGVLLVDTDNVTVVGNPTLDPPQMTVSGGTWNNGDTVSITKSGTGTVSSVDFSAKTMVLSASNDQWISGYHVATATKPIVSTTAYLRFNAAGEVTGYQPTPVEPRAMTNLSNPALTFPATLPDTGTAPDAEFPDSNAFIQTSVQLKNATGDSAVVKSNAVVPTTTGGFVVPAGAVVNNAAETEEQLRLLATHDQRIADHTAAKYQALAAEAQAKIRRYTP